MLTTTKLSASLDLHGKSLKEAQLLVQNFIEKAKEEKIAFLRIITGKGNHPNQNGSRGLIYKNLVRWLNHQNSKPYIKSIEPKEGSYLVTLNVIPELLLNPPTNLFPKKYIKRGMIEEETKLSAIINNNISLDQKIQNLEALLNIDRKLLYETDSQGNTILMKAAASNQVEIMDFLLKQEAILFIQPTLLKQKNHTGNNVLIKAVEAGQLLAIKYLLNHAHSLLKGRNSENESVFKFILNTSNPNQVLDCLFNFLNQHKRDLGYTGLFPEYRACRQHLLNIATTKENTSTSILKKQMKYKKVTQWFYTDRMLNFINKLKKSAGKLDTVLKNTLFLHNQKVFVNSKSIIKNLLNQDNKFKKLFIRFNNFLKPRIKKRFKHAINHSIPNILEKTIIRKKLKNVKKTNKKAILLSTKVITGKMSLAAKKPLSTITHIKISSEQKEFKPTPLTFSYSSIVMRNLTVKTINTAGSPQIQPYLEEKEEKKNQAKPSKKMAKKAKKKREKIKASYSS